MVHSILYFIGFFKDCLKTFVIDLVILLVSLCIIYHCDKLAVSVTFAIFSIYILPQKVLLLVLIHRFILTRKRIKLSINIIIGSFSIWLIAYFFAFFCIDNFLREISNRLFGRIEYKFNNIFIGDVYTIIADLAMIIIILCLYFSNKQILTKQKYIKNY